MKQILRYAVVAILAGFGFLTLFLSTSVIFDLFNVREREGNYVLFIVWANFISSLIYLASVYGFLTLKKWTYKALAASTLVLTIAFIGLQFHIHSGGVHEEKTIWAMVFRIAVTIGLTLYAYFTLNKTAAKSK